MSNLFDSYWSGITELASGASWSVEVSQESARRNHADVTLESHGITVAPMTADEIAELINALQTARRELGRAKRRGVDA